VLVFVSVSELGWSDLAPTVPILLGPLLLKELLVLLLSPHFFLEFGDLLLLVFVFFDEATIFLFHR
jgi:hypothetical protein